MIQKLTKLLFLLGVSINAHDSEVIPFQGQIAQQSGQPLSPGDAISVVFRFYRAPVGGEVIWEELQPNISVNAGRFSVLLGSREALPAHTNFNATLYLGMTVDDGDKNTTDVEMRPRQALVPVISASYAKEAAKLNGYDWSALLADGSNNPTTTSISEHKLPSGVTVPIGAVIMWWGSLNQIPSGFELCDGQPPRTPSATLSGPKPDLRDKFVKGATSDAIDVKGVVVTGGTHELNLSHSHSTSPHFHRVNPHRHNADYLWVPFTSALGAFWWRDAEFFRGGVPGGHNSVRQRERTSDGSEFANGTAVFGETGDAAPDTSIAAPDTDQRLSSQTDNRPAFLELFYIIRVK